MCTSCDCCGTYFGFICHCRNLAKPISVQTELMEKKYKEKYDFFKVQKEREEEIKARREAGRKGQKKKDKQADRSDVFDDELDDPKPEPHHYGSHYSNSGIVLYFLIRLPPFTKMFVRYQGEETVLQALLKIQQCFLVVRDVAVIECVVLFCFQTGILTCQIELSTVSALLGDSPAEIRSLM